MWPIAKTCPHGESHYTLSAHNCFEEYYDHLPSQLLHKSTQADLSTFFSLLLNIGIFHTVYILTAKHVGSMNETMKEISIDLGWF